MHETVLMLKQEAVNQLITFDGSVKEELKPDICRFENLENLVMDSKLKIQKIFSRLEEKFESHRISFCNEHVIAITDSVFKRATLPIEGLLKVFESN